MTRLDRLRELVRGAGSESATSSGSVTAGRNGVEPDAEWVAQALGGSLEPSPEGAYVVVRRTYEKDSRHGRRAIWEYPVPSRELLGVLGGQSGGPSTVAETDSVVCLDLETTGLRGGAGTFAFVVGFGWFEQGAFRTHQFVLSQLSAERRMLQAAAEVVGRATTLLTFNGKSFDAPVMETRWALHRLPSPLEALRHVDLLHPARRLWRSDEGRLASLERAVLGLRRVDDVPGAEVPGRYVAFLRSSIWCHWACWQAWPASSCEMGQRPARIQSRPWGLAGFTSGSGGVTRPSPAIVALPEPTALQQLGPRRCGASRSTTDVGSAMSRQPTRGSGCWNYRGLQWGCSRRRALR